MLISALATGPPAGVGGRARTVSGCVNSAFLNISLTFYGPSVQAMDTPLNALHHFLFALRPFRAA